MQKWFMFNDMTEMNKLVKKCVRLVQSDKYMWQSRIYLSLFKQQL